METTAIKFNGGDTYTAGKAQRAKSSRQTLANGIYKFQILKVQQIEDFQKNISLRIDCHPVDADGNSVNDFWSTLWLALPLTNENVEGHVNPGLTYDMYSFLQSQYPDLPKFAVKSKDGDKSWTLPDGSVVTDYAKVEQQNQLVTVAACDRLSEMSEQGWDKALKGLTFSARAKTNDKGFSNIRKVFYKEEQLDGEVVNTDPSTFAAPSA